MIITISIIMKIMIIMHDNHEQNHHHHHNQPVVVTLKLLVQGQTKAVEEESKEFLEEKETDTPVE